MSATNPGAQQQKSQEQLARSITNLNMAARGIAAQQAAQAAARAAAQAAVSNVPDGLGEGGLKIDSNSLTAGWTHANAPKQSVADGKTHVAVEQTADKAILNWETFNVGKNTTVEFQQQKDWAVLNRVNDPQARPSQIQGQIKADGTVMIVNRNGIVFSGSSQVDTRNLVAAAVGLNDGQFAKGIYSEAQGNQSIPTFANDLTTTASSFSHTAASGDVVVQQGAQITTRKSSSVTEGGGYVILMGRDTHNQGIINTAAGQTVLATGDAFVIKKGMGSDANQNSTTRGSVVTPLLSPNSQAGTVSNSGLLLASTGDITMTGRDVRQQGVAVATTSVHTRGTVHLTTAATDAQARVLLDKDSVTAVVLDEKAATALDTQRDALIAESAKVGEGVAHRRDQSLIQIESAAGAVDFVSDSLTLATGGQVLVNAAKAELAKRALLDVSGAVGVQVAMESNNVLINVQGNEQRDAPVNRDSDMLRNSDIWIDRRYLVKVSAGTNGYETDRWYTAGGLLEVGGYLGISGHSVGEWSAQGGIVQFTGAELKTQAGSLINLAGGTLDVQTGYVHQTFLKGMDGQLYSVSSAPGDLQYSGLYKGFETESGRWGDAAKKSYYNPFVAPATRLENGYTVGRDAGRLIVATQSAVLNGDLDTSVYQGPQQTRGRDAGLDGYQQAQTAVAQRGQLVIGALLPVYDSSLKGLLYSPQAVASEITLGQENDTGMSLDATWVNAQNLGGLQVYAKDAVTVQQALQVAAGGQIALHASSVDVQANLTARSGQIALGDLVNTWGGQAAGWTVSSINAIKNGEIVIGEGVTLDASGLWSNLQLDSGDISGLPFLHGGRIAARSSGRVTVDQGALLDVSSGAALRANGSTQGGRGGDITLVASGLLGAVDSGERLVLRGELRGHGVLGGGTLHLQTGDAVAIGGQVPGGDGTLQAGQTSPIDLVLQDALTIEAGGVLPMDVSFTRTRAMPGELMGSAPQIQSSNPASWVTLTEDWTPPRPTSSFYAITTSAGTLQIRASTPLPVLSAGTVIRALTGTAFPKDYVVPAAFANGFPVVPSTGMLLAGAVASEAVTYAAGTVLRAGLMLQQPVAVSVSVTSFDTELFHSGFARHELVGGRGLVVAPGAVIDVTQPVLRLDTQLARGIATGGELAAALTPVLDPLFIEDAVASQLKRRGGASLALMAGIAPGAMASLSIGEGSRITVDAGQTLKLAANGQIAIEGTLQAAGGRIDVLPQGYKSEREVADSKGHQRSVWIGEKAVLDVSGIAASALNAQGKRYGKVLEGGSIQIGGVHPGDAGVAEAIDNFIVVRPGAKLNASGSSAVLDIPMQGEVELASNGGLIHLSSFNGLYLEGEMRAAAGGESAAGGRLSLVLETPNYANADGPTDTVRQARNLFVQQTQQPELLAADLRPARTNSGLTYGHSRIGVDRIKAGGFGQLDLLANGVITLEPGLDLALSQSLRLTARSISLPDGATSGAQVKLDAPYVRLAGATRQGRDNFVMPVPGSSMQAAVTLTDVVDGSRLLVESSLLDVRDTLTFGTWGFMRQESGEQKLTQSGFETVELRSQGDIRMLASSVNEQQPTSLATVGDMVLAASQIYPVTLARADIIAGRREVVTQWGSTVVEPDPARSLRIERTTDLDPPMPYSAFGALNLLSANIEQGGVLRAPLGQIGVGVGNGSNTFESRVTLLPGSLTSVSAHGLVMPYGGTIDNLSYMINGTDALYYGLGGAMGNVLLAATAVDVQSGARLDLRGGGDLQGAGFLQGRGGSTDARLHPLVQTRSDGSFVLPQLSTNPVYAIVPGLQASTAPAGGEQGAGAPAVGRQIFIGDGVPGLAAGTYTLLPSTYALLPGAFRVELNGLAVGQARFGSTIAMRNGSYTTAARLGVANTEIVDTLTTQAVLTPGQTLRSYSQYNETSYAQFGLDWAVRDNVPRPQLERDARQLTLEAQKQLSIAQGVADFTPAADGRGGSVVLKSSRIEVLADGASATAGFDGLSVRASELNGLGAAGINLGVDPSSLFAAVSDSSTQNAWQVNLGGGTTDEIILRKGAVLSAGQVLLGVSSNQSGLTVEQGAGIDTLGKGRAPWDSSQGFVLQPGQTGVLALSNGWLDVLPSAADSDWGSRGAGYLHIGVCGGISADSCSGETRLYAEGTITAATNKSFQLDESVSYAARNLVLAMGKINVGSGVALEQAENAGLLTAGLTLNQAILDRLMRGDSSIGAPALENLVLTARDSVNFYGSINLSTLDPVSGKSSLQRLVLGTPAIYGYGSASDVARIETDTLVWSGARTPAGEIVTGGAGTGAGRFVTDARQIEFGFGPKSQADGLNSQDRLMLGFNSVDFNASERITANRKGALSVYATRGGWDDAAKAWQYSGGDLRINTPQLTGQAGSDNTIKAGGNITALAGAGVVAAADNATLREALGATLTLQAGGSLTLDTAVLLPSGKLSLKAQDDVVLGDGAQLDLAGRKIDFFDVSQFSWGGDVLLQSMHGNVQQAAASNMALDALNNRAGRLTVHALQGVANLAGSISGQAAGHYDAGGTKVPFAAGYADIRAMTIADFSDFNNRLNAGGMVGGRSFQLGQGDLVIGDELKAREINVSVDNGSLTVNGHVDASGEQAGSIRLAANRGVVIGGAAVLDASASVLRRDSYGQVIDAPNRAVIEIDSGEGRLVLDSGARMNLAVAGALANYGTVVLNAPRLGGAMGNDVDIQASGTVQIDGARSIIVNAFQSYTDAPQGTEATVDHKAYQYIDQEWLGKRHQESSTFMSNALANTALMQGKLAGLRAYNDQFHLRPGVEVLASGDLHIDGDIDLSGYRYESVNPHIQKTSSSYGSGEAGALVLRAGGDLAVFGSISDGFDGSRLGASPDDRGWVLPAGRMPFGGDLIIPHSGMATLDVGTVFKTGRTLNYDLPVAGLSLPAGAVLPAVMPLAQNLTLAGGTILSGDIWAADGITVLHKAGTVLEQALTLTAGQKLGAGFRANSALQLGETVWPAGAQLPADMTLSKQLALLKGAVVPSLTDVVLPGGALLVSLRTNDADANNSQGSVWALAPMLAAGSQSSDLRLVAGADLSAADSRLTRVDGHGSLRLADAHFGLGSELRQVPGTGNVEYSWGAGSSDFFMIMDLWGMGLSFSASPGDKITAEQVTEMLEKGAMWEQNINSLNDWGFGEVASFSGTPAEMANKDIPAHQQLFSVLRTGTGDLDLLAAGNFEMSSPFGVYTAGTQSASLGAAYNLPRGLQTNNSLLHAEGAAYEKFINGGSDSLYQAWYPERGGNVLLRAGGDIKGDLVGRNRKILETTYALSNTRQQIATVEVGSWLWRQGTGSLTTAEESVPTAWWINFGTYVAGGADGDRDEYQQWLLPNYPFLVGFTGVGTLGGGNLTVQAGGNAGMIDARGGAPLNTAVPAQSERTLAPRSQGLHLAVASTGRVTADGQLVQTGGGDLDLRLGGSLNPNPQLMSKELDLNSTFVNLRGAMHIDAAAVGGIQMRYGLRDPLDIRVGDPFAADSVYSLGGPVLVLGDAAARIETRGDLVLGGVADAGRTQLLSATPFSYGGKTYARDGWSWFSLWTPATAIDLLSAGGNLTPTAVLADADGQEDTFWNRDGHNTSSNRDGYYYPSILRAAAANGSIYYGAGSTDQRNSFGNTPVRVAFGVTLAPSPIDSQFVNVTGKGQLQLLASDSLFASGFPITASTADPLGMASVFRPGFVGRIADTGGGQWGFEPKYVYNVADVLVDRNSWIGGAGGRKQGASLFTFGDTATAAYAVQGQDPARYYAVNGDIVGLRMGQEVVSVKDGTTVRYEASMPVTVHAGRDIVRSGTLLGQQDTVSGAKTTQSNTRGNLIAHAFDDDISVIEAGRDIRYSSFYVAGPGVLEVSAGRDVYLADKGEIKSLGSIVEGASQDRASGASIAVAAGLGVGAHWGDFAERYLDSANLVNPDLPFSEQPGKAFAVYGGALTLAQWLAQEFGYSGGDAEAPAFMAQQQALLDQPRQQALAVGATASNRSLAREYQAQSQLHLVNWLTQRYGAQASRAGRVFDAASMDARSFFDALPAEQQRAFLRGAYYAELRAAGREYNEVDGKRSGSYVRGREAIATLFPEQDSQGKALDYSGDLTMFSSAVYFTGNFVNNPVGTRRPKAGVDYVSYDDWVALGSPYYGVSHYKILDAGIHTNLGGDIDIMTPGGRTLVGVDGGFVPGAGSGVMTLGEGDINIYAQSDILMGQSRIFTTFGGNILGWSAEGDINAGRGAKTTVVATPQRRVYDWLGNVTLSPSTPSNGAGIATLNPIPEVAPGDIDLIAPLGTIDAGEAGIRVSGNVNLAALQVVNAQNIQVQGKATGIPMVAAVNVAAMTNASAAASQATSAAQEEVQRQREAARKAMPSVFTVRVLGFGTEPMETGDKPAPAPLTPAAKPGRVAYDPQSALQFVAIGKEVDAQVLARLSDEQRRQLRQ
ncbi:filamentous hemagglutinin family protein [Comamonas sp. Tr-654]|uniref:filamentous hemagglutinin family protein n=1 Tax=Comamonas sp. Tr-654 TaxID=2608341 RepID=UPI00142358CB|nr:filamentous hemagglutinin family protein [Comamonas sp. Tr-654]